MSSKPISFAYRVPNVLGGLVVSNVEQRTALPIVGELERGQGFDFGSAQSEAS